MSLTYDNSGILVGASGTVRALTVSNTGSVGIGYKNNTTIPPSTYALDISGTINTNNGINLSYSTLPTFTSTQIGYTVNYSFPGASQLTGIRTYSLSLPVGVWQLFAYTNFDTAQTTGNYHQFIVSSARYALSFIPTNSLTNTNTISAIVGLTGTTSVDYQINITVNTTFALGGGQTRYYAVRIA